VFILNGVDLVHVEVPPRPSGSRIEDLEEWLMAVRRAYERSEYGGDYFDLLLSFSGDVVSEDESGGIRLVDLWGNPLGCLCTKEGEEFIVTVYSFGPNGKDEGGAGDDIGATRRGKPGRLRPTTTNPACAAATRRAATRPATTPPPATSPAAGDTGD
jgi:hypothetical protein